MKSTYALFYLLLFSVFGYAQGYDIGGTVKEEKTGLPMPGVNVGVKNSLKSVQTDMDGNFNLTGIPAGSVVVFSSIGFTNYQYKVTESANNVSVLLKEDSKMLDEVVVIGYGTQLKREVTGAVGVVNAKTIERLKPIKVDQVLQGVAGVIVSGGTGAPNSSFDVKIRGVGSNGNTRPLVIIDGYAGNMSDLNPSDIESLSILKDSQAAIYGVGGANGVILITTKKGKKNTKAQVRYAGYTGFQETTRQLPLLNATEYALLLNESYANGGQALPFPNASGLGKGTDWQGELFKKGAPIINHEFSVSGGSEKITYSVSASDLTQEGIIADWDKSRFKRNSARLSLAMDISDKLKVNTNITYTYFNSRGFNDNGLGSVLFNAVNIPATLTPYDADSNYTLVPNTPGLGIEIINPLAQLANTYNDGGYKKINGTFGIDYEPITGLTMTTRIGFNTGHGYGKNFSKMVSYGGKVFDVNRSRVDQSTSRNDDYTFDLFGNYKRTIAENHNFTLTGGMTITKEWGSGLSASAYDVPNNSWEFADISLANGYNGRDVGSYKFDERQLSYFGRLQYDYKGKYLASFMGRRDASTKFGPANTVAYFPSMTAGWVISKEGFYGEERFVSFMKLRGSYGSLGNDRIGNNRYASLLNGEATYVFDGALANGTAIGTLANPEVLWEKAKKLDIGLDFNFWKNRFTVVADYYDESRKDLLIDGLPVSGIAGGSAPGSGSPTVNAGTINNSGLEFSIGYAQSLSDKFKIDLNYNFTTIRNRVTDVKGEDNILQGGNFGVGQPPISRMQEGYAIGYFYGYQTDGIFQNADEVNAHPSQIALGAEAQPGDIRFKDLNGDGVITALDKTNLGDPIPDLIMGFNLSMVYKGFDFSVYTYASLGNDIVRNYERTLSDVNRLDYVLDRWTGEGTSNTVPRVTTAATGNNVFSDYFVEDGSYLRIQNMQLGYTLSRDFTSKIGIDKLKLYVAANNLYTFTKYKGYDPGAVGSAPIGGGIDNGSYPAVRTYMLGVNINF
ncbi:MAG: SusC/RagA family protein [Flavobacterium sp. BFFFF1]|uniref:SusC/RagA family TonB-linked outer membrane protein n=1 Tax=Flavobacterium sp. BFFFF1 TaxID=2015557 RepID=UPI000BD6CED7|nr:TonB-dependent receptor [Flavobacterium sp. BFFFF1]OYU79429.1 MAG: SusC/RagA family protein [Flavobacterium sp. BFFFF1]